MCMEDILLARKTFGSQVVLTVGATAQRVLAYSASRVTIIFAAPSAGNVTFSLDPGLAATNGIFLAAGDPPFRLTLDHDGDLVRRQWHGIADAADRVVTIFLCDLNEGINK